MGRTKGGLKADPGGSVHGAIREDGQRIADDVAGLNRPDEECGAEKESMVYLCGPWRRKSPKVPSVKEWWCMG